MEQAWQGRLNLTVRQPPRLGLIDFHLTEDPSGHRIAPRRRRSPLEEQLAHDNGNGTHYERYNTDERGHRQRESRAAVNVHRNGLVVCAPCTASRQHVDAECHETVSVSYTHLRAHE